VGRATASLGYSTPIFINIKRKEKKEKHGTLSTLDLSDREEVGGGVGDEERINERYQREKGVSKDSEQLGK